MPDNGSGLLGSVVYRRCEWPDPSLCLIQSMPKVVLPELPEQTVNAVTFRMDLACK